MPAYKITVAYDGTGFVGWQRQASGESVQGVLEDALRALDGREVAVVGAGRTDAGVHALGQVAGFSLRRAVAPEVVIRALNARLPGRVRVTAAGEVPPSFHARFSARSKTYLYRIWNGEVADPFERAFAWHVPGPLAVESMQTAARLLEGRHDFAAFGAAGGATGPTEHTLFSSLVRVERAGLAGSIWPAPRQAGPDGRLLICEVTGDGFLRHMVRAIAGSLVEVGRGRRSPDWIRAVVAARDRSQAGPTAPPHGLFLAQVDYDAAPPDC
jgi:tRNA pseudouridine38-40 synthase